MQYNVEVARWTSERPGFASARKPDPGSVFDAGGNLGIYRALAKKPALARSAAIA